MHITATPRRAACRLPLPTTIFASDEPPPPPEEDIADDNPPPHTNPATIMTPAVPWSTMRVPVLETDAANIQAWLASVRSIIAFHDASQLLTNAVPRTAAGRALARQILLVLSQTIDGSLSSCLVEDDPPRPGLPYLLGTPPTPTPSKPLPPPSTIYALLTPLLATTRDFTVSPTLLITTWTSTTTMPPY
jgi:hypothetical protein